MIRFTIVTCNTNHIANSMKVLNLIMAEKEKKSTLYPFVSFVKVVMNSVLDIETFVRIK